MFIRSRLLFTFWRGERFVIARLGDVSSHSWWSFRSGSSFSPASISGCPWHPAGLTGEKPTSHSIRRSRMATSEMISSRHRSMRCRANPGQCRYRAIDSRKNFFDHTREFLLDLNRHDGISLEHRVCRDSCMRKKLLRRLVSFNRPTGDLGDNQRTFVESDREFLISTFPGLCRHPRGTMRVRVPGCTGGESGI